MNLSIQDLLILGTVLGGTLGVIQALVALGDRLWGKRTHDLAEAVEALQAIAERPIQSFDCRSQHNEIRTVLENQQQVTNALLDAIKTLAEGIKSSSHAAELRHEQVIANLKLVAVTQENIVSQLREIARR